MAVACSRSPVGAVASGKHGIGMLSIGGTSDEALLAHAKNWSIHEEAAAKAGKTPDRSKWRIVTFAHVAETREKARADMAYGLADFARYFTDVATFPIIPPDVTDPVEHLTSTGLACIGTPDDCIRHFERLWLGSNGGFGAVLLLAHNWADWEATKRSYELMARYVHPHFQRQSNALGWRATTMPRPSTRRQARSPRRPCWARSRSTKRRRRGPEAAHALPDHRLEAGGPGRASRTPA